MPPLQQLHTGRTHKGRNKRCALHDRQLQFCPECGGECLCVKHKKYQCMACHFATAVWNRASKRLNDKLAEGGRKRKGPLDPWVGTSKPELAAFLMADLIQRGLNPTNSRNSLDHKIPLKLISHTSVKEIFIGTHCGNLQIIPWVKNSRKGSSYSTNSLQQYWADIIRAGFVDTEDADKLRQKFFEEGTEACTSATSLRMSKKV